MSQSSIDMKKEQMLNYINHHPDSRICTIEDTGEEFGCLFDYAYYSDNRDAGNVEQNKREPHITFSSEFSHLLIPRHTKISVNGHTYTVYIVKDDLTEETFQAEAWLV